LILRIDRYISSTVFKAMLVVLIAFVGLNIVFQLVDELREKYVGYGFWQAVVYVLLTLPDDPQRYPVAGKVAWITPARAAGNRAPGVGIRFPSDEKSRQLKARIEEALGATLASDRPTQTI